MPTAGHYRARLLLCQTAQSPADGWFTPLNAGPREVGGRGACLCLSIQHLAGVGYTAGALLVVTVLPAPPGGSSLPPVAPALSPHSPRQSRPQSPSPSHRTFQTLARASGLPGELPTVQGRRTHILSRIQSVGLVLCPGVITPEAALWVVPPSVTFSHLSPSPSSGPCGAGRGLHVCFDDVLLCLELALLSYLLCDLGM